MKQDFLKTAILTAIIIPSLVFTSDENLSTEPAPIEAVENQPPQSASEQEGISCGYLFDRSIPVYYGPSTHWLAAICKDRGTVQLEIEDGSVWKISNYDQYKIQSWCSKDPLTITQNSRWFTKHKYMIINQNTGSTVEATLFRGPVVDGEYSLYIVSTNPSKTQFLLNNNTYWDISYFDAMTAHKWGVGDSVIIGYNSGYDSSCEGILINVTMDNFCRAKQL